VFAALTISAGANSVDSTSIQVSVFNGDTGISHESLSTERGAAAIPSAARTPTAGNTEQADSSVNEGPSSRLVGFVFGLFDESGRLAASDPVVPDPTGSNERFVGSPDGTMPDGTEQPPSIAGQDDSTSRVSSASSVESAMLPNTVFEQETPTAVNGSPITLLSTGLGKIPLVWDRIM
jgi:hypothetical protein